MIYWGKKDGLPPIGMLQPTYFKPTQGTMSSVPPSRGISGTTLAISSYYDGH